MKESDSAQQLGTLPGRLLAMLPCPLKVPLEEEYTRQAQTKGWTDPASEDIQFLGNANQSAFYKKVDQIQSDEELPDVIVSPGVSSFFHTAFKSRFLDRDCFADAAAYEVPNARFSGIGLRDPLGRVTVPCINPLVLVVDQTRLGGLPEPRSWKDLLDPMYRKSLTMRGHNGSFCETVLLSLLRLYGHEALTRLGEAAKYGAHPAEMARSAGIGKPDGTPFYIMPLFYAKLIPRQDRIRIIWPEEGAIVSPVFLFAKRSGRERSGDIADFFTNLQSAAIYERASFPSLHPEVEPAGPESQSYLWMGWDWIWEADIKSLTQDANDAFLKGFNGVAGS